MNARASPTLALGTQEIDRHCMLDAASETLLKQAIARLNLSARAYHRVLKLARSVADLAGKRRHHVGASGRGDPVLAGGFIPAWGHE
jgi:predicted ATPase with chaperone activity